MYTGSVCAGGQLGTIVDDFDHRSAQWRSRSVRWRWLLWLAICACSGSRATGTVPSSVGSSSSGAPPPFAQSAYEYAGCRNEDGGGCPRLKTLVCALRTIASKYDRCAQHADCVQATVVPKCSGAGNCPPYFVNGKSKVSFEADAQREIDRYCSGGDCSYSDPCGWLGLLEPYCASEHCTYIHNQ